MGRKSGLRFGCSLAAGPGSCEGMWGPDDLFFLALAHPYKVLAVVAALWLRFMLTSGSIPQIPGSKVISVKSVTHWNSLRRDAKENGQLVAAEFYAPWVRPCHVSGPAFAKMSIEFDKSVLFVKCDTDVVEEMKAAAEIKSLPTYQLWKGDEKLTELKGWDEKKLRLMLDGWATLHKMQQEPSDTAPRLLETSVVPSKKED